MKNFKFEVYKLVKKIPEGKVSTYGQISKELGSKNYELRIDARIVGWILHQNKDPNVPCHRVVDRNGRLAPNFGGPSLESFGRQAPSKFQRSGAFDGWEEQKRRLEAEGVKFVDEMHVDLDRSLCQEKDIVVP